jgi:uncharacterized coiled-coil protein SlyX
MERKSINASFQLQLRDLSDTLVETSETVAKTSKATALLLDRVESFCNNDKRGISKGSDEEDNNDYEKSGNNRRQSYSSRSSVLPCDYE